MQTPPKSEPEPEPVECPKPERPSLKRARSVLFSAPASAEPASAAACASMHSLLDDLADKMAASFTQQLEHALTTRRTSPTLLSQVFTELEAMPHPPMKTARNARELRIKHMIMMDRLLEATVKAHASTHEGFERTPWGEQHAANFAVLDGQAEGEDGTVVPDGCAICGVVKTECMKQDEHFGPRGESPPDARCAHCSKNFHNNYDSGYKLQLHVAEKHAAKE